jgi:hypothetical protein
MTEPLPIWCRALPTALLLLLLAEAAGGGFAVVRLRQDGAARAEAATKLQAQIHEAGRQLQETDMQVTAAQEPDALRARVANRLSPMLDKQIVWVRPNALPNPEAVTAPALQLAYLEPAPNLASPR